VQWRAVWRFRPDAQAGGGKPAPGGRHRRGSGWWLRPPAAAAAVTALSLGFVVTAPPAAGAAGDIATGFTRAVRQIVSGSQTGRAFSGTAAIGALFSWSDGKLGSHFCTGSVVSSPHGNLVVTAAHCVSGIAAGKIAFVPGYNRGTAPYGVWPVTRIYADQAWTSSQDPDDDVAFLQVAQSGSAVPIEEVTGAEQLRTGTPARQLVDVIGYPDGADLPIACRAWTTEPMADQMAFVCGGYTDGTSGGPFLADVDQATGQGTVIGVIGGYEQGGDSPAVSYSSVFGTSVASLYAEAVSGG
jgi:V8-like Glu-specific endopeptidase